MPTGINPSIFYIGLVLLIIASGFGVYFKVIPVDILVALVSALVGHGFTLTTQHLQKNGTT